MVYMFSFKVRLGQNYNQRQKELDLFMNKNAGSAGPGLMAANGL